MTGLSDHCFGCKTECKTKEAVGRAIRASSGLQGGGAFAQTHGEERLQQGCRQAALGPLLLCWEQCRL